MAHGEERARVAAARGQADQGIPAALQRQLPRRQALPAREGESRRSVPALSAHPPARRTTARATSGRSRIRARCADARAVMRKKFDIRTCRPRVPGEDDYRHCLSHIIKNCSAPCVDKINRAGYLASGRARPAIFSTAQSHEMLDELKAEMQAAAAKLDFERAAEMRNLLDDLKQHDAPMRRFTRKAPCRRDRSGGRCHRAGGRARSCRDRRASWSASTSRTSPPRTRSRSMVRFRDGKPDKADYRRYRIKTVEGQDDFASMAEVVRRRYSRILLETRALSPDTAASRRKTRSRPRVGWSASLAWVGRHRIAAATRWKSRTSIRRSKAGRPRAPRR